MSAKQLEQKKGMVSLIGDMGTGKNYVVEHFAAKTHRPYFYFPCSRGMDAADLGFHFEFRKGESITVPSQLAKGLRTKNAVILIDEPNALPPEVVSALHGLADHNRTFVYNGVKFEAAEGVVIVMAMNPATYAHVKDLPEAFSDRTLGMDMRLDYPPLTKLDELAQNSLMSKAEREKALQEDNTLDKKFVCDEALILRGQFPSLKKWGDEEFAKLWDVVANGASAASLGEKAKELDALRPDVEVLFKILKICDAWRKKYQAGDMQRTISLRGSTAVAENYLRIHDVRKAFLDLYKPNSLKFDGGREDYETLEQVLNDLGELEKQINKEGA
jgi:MoxR-like ATPase